MKKTIEVLLTAVSLAGAGFGAPTTCASPSAIVMAKNSVLLHCDTDWPDTPAFGELWRLPPNWNKDPRQRGTLLDVKATVSETVQPDKAYRLINFSQDLEPGLAYYLVLKLPGDPSLAVLISTIPEATIERAKIKDQWGLEFIVHSPVALSSALSPLADRKFFELIGSDAKPHDACILIIYDERPTPNMPCTPRPTDPPHLVNAGLARVELLDGKLTQATVGARVEGLKNIFGETVKAQTKPDKPIELAAAPATKDAASWYLKFGHQKVKGSPYSLSIDLKINPTLTHLGPWDVQPDVVVDIAENEPASANPRSSDTIKLGGNLYYLKMFDPTKKPFLAAIDLKPGGGLETDREISKKNILGNAESQLYIRGLYNTTETQTRKRAATQNVSMTEVTPASYGYSIGIFMGFEAGASVVEQTFKNKAKTASIKVPTYGIARFWPRVHQTYELRRVTLDVNSTLKYLSRTELVGHENADGTLNLRPVKGFRFYDEASVSVALDRGKHANLVVTWKRGAKAPNWGDTNALITGFGFAY